ncbi:MAG: TetR/AcrR family transcriptional regulator [Ruminococcaceae bacterium]|nr:TetR/AcrR family transcriptional regulator [Oscillospiraceae bacterium]
MKKGLITQKNILCAAEEVFSEKGLFGARVDEISERAGCNKRMIYAHFGSKEGLYTAVLNNVYRKLSITEENLLSESLSPADAVSLYIKLLFNFLKDNPTFVKMVMWENLNEAKYMRMSGASDLKNVSVKVLENILKQGVQQGVFKSDINIKEIIISINMFCFSCFSNVYTMTDIMNIDFFNAQELELRLATITDMILSYILKQ